MVIVEDSFGELFIYKTLETNRELEKCEMFFTSFSLEYTWVSLTRSSKGSSIVFLFVYFGFFSSFLAAYFGAAAKALLAWNSSILLGVDLQLLGTLT